MNGSSIKIDDNLYCEVCEKTFSTKYVLRDHYNSAKHKRNILN